jgi:hypothetical protein
MSNDAEIDRLRQLHAEACAIAARYRAERDAMWKALEYAVAQYERPHEFSPLQNHWVAVAHNALSSIELSERR